MSEPSESATADKENGNGCARSLLQRSMSKQAQNVDDLYNKLGNPGRLQIIWFLLLACNLLSVSPNAVVGVFFGFSPAHFCNASVDWSDVAQLSKTAGTPLNGTLASNNNRININDSYTISSGSGYSISNAVNQGNIHFIHVTPGLNISTPNNQGESKVGERKQTAVIYHGECSVNLTLKETNGVPRMSKANIPCRRGQWVYDVTEGEATTVSDFDLVCDYSYLTYLASTLYYLGLILANVTLGYASDVFGRRPVILVTLHVILVTALGIAFSTNFAMFAVLRVVMGLLTQGLLSSSFVLAIELFPVQHRGKAGTIMQVFWGLGCLYLSGVAWLARDWRMLQLWMLVPSVFGAVTMWFVGESLRWQLARGKTKPASRLVSRIATFNKVSNPIKGDDHSVLAEYKIHYVKQHGSYLSLVRTPQMRKRTMCLSLMMFGINFGYFGMTYNNAELAGDRYLNFFLGSLGETICYLAGIFIVARYGRRRPLFASLLSGSVCCLISGVIPKSGATNNTLIIIFSVLGRFSMAACYTTCDMFAAELFPTVVRNMGVGVATFTGRIGSALSPQVSALRHVTFSQFPPLVFAAFALAGAIAALLLPETSGQHLPDTVDDVENSSGCEKSNQSGPPSEKQQGASTEVWQNPDNKDTTRQSGKPNGGKNLDVNCDSAEMDKPEEERLLDKNCHKRALEETPMPGESIALRGVGDVLSEGLGREGVHVIA